MTDSGGYQVLEYGEVDVKPPAMAKFETGYNDRFCNTIRQTDWFWIIRLK